MSKASLKTLRMMHYSSLLFLFVHGEKDVDIINVYDMLDR